MSNMKFVNYSPDGYFETHPDDYVRRGFKEMYKAKKLNMAVEACLQYVDWEPELECVSRVYYCKTHNIPYACKANTEIIVRGLLD